MNKKKTLEEKLDKEFYKELREQSVSCIYHNTGYCYKNYFEPERCHNEKNWFFSLLGKESYDNIKKEK